MLQDECVVPAVHLCYQPQSRGDPLYQALKLAVAQVEGALLGRGGAEMSLAPACPVTQCFSFPL